MSSGSIQLWHSEQDSRSLLKTWQRLGAAVLPECKVPAVGRVSRLSGFRYGLYQELAPWLCIAVMYGCPGGLIVIEYFVMKLNQLEFFKWPAQTDQLLCMCKLQRQPPVLCQHFNFFFYNTSCNLQSVERCLVLQFCCVPKRLKNQCIVISCGSNSVL